MFVCSFAAAALFWALSAKAQSDDSETVHGVVVFTTNGEQTPLLLPEQNKLTPLGAQQLFTAGSDIRDRYIVPFPSSANDTDTNDPISGISAFSLDNSQLSALSTIDEYILSSAQAFFQGLYPPTKQSAIDPYVSSLSQLSNNTNINNPLNGYQYAQIESASLTDPSMVWVAGNAYCPMYTISGAEYYITDDFHDTLASSSDLYQGLKSTASRLGDLIQDGDFSYVNADVLYDYVNYEYNHNSSFKSMMPASTLSQLRNLASQQAWALNGNLTVSGAAPGDRIQAVGGSTLAGKILGLLVNNVASKASTEKLNLLFGTYEPVMSFFALTRLANPDNGADFYGIPEPGSSMAFQLFDIGNNTKDYPLEEDLWVRFLFRNGTANGTELTPFPMFGRGHSQTDMMWTDFKTEMEAIMIYDVGTWCDACQSEAVFCAAYGSNDTYWSNQTLSATPKTSSGMAPVVAGVIGAVVTLAIIMLALAVAMLLGGVRFRRITTKRRSDLGGFKGAEKLASDVDLPASGAGAGAGASAAAGAKGHERIGSWEMNNTDNSMSPGLRPATPPRAASMHFESGEHHDGDVDPFADPVRPHDSV
ncbi:MAG: hypothetical protein M4579_001152 [Chaenotheca gracillima]|nr:MAG: hypothetical protein M4579_001152 [Chaenotheca gracillima]